MTDKENYDFIDHVVHLTIFAEDRLLSEHGGEYSRLQEDGIDSNEYYRIITERVINILKKNKNYMQEEPVSEELEDFAKRQADEFAEREYEGGSYDRGCLSKGYYWGCKAGAKWQKEHLWKPAYGDDLPKTDGWTIVLTECKAPWIAHNEEKPFYSVDLARWSKYVKGWNLSNVKWWMDCLLPNMEED